MLGIVCGFIVLLSLKSSVAERFFCPPPNFVSNAKRPGGYRTAIIGEVHGKLWVQTQDQAPTWSEYFDGHQLSRNLYFQVGVLGIDKIYLTVFYNETLYPTPPPIEAIYPPQRSCVVDWYNLGVLEWRPEVYPGKVETGPWDKRARDRDYHKTHRGYNPIYEEIRNETDWVFVQDMDELLLPVNFDATSRSDWCAAYQPPLITRIIEQMMATATRQMVQSWTYMMSYAKLNKVLDSTNACPLGMSLCPYVRRCKPITAFMIPVHLWIRGPHASWDSLPTVRSIYPASEASKLKTRPSDGIEERWKSVYQTRYNPLLQGMSIHDNGADHKTLFAVLAPRQFHGGLSLELMHQRWDNHELTRENVTRLMARDFKLVHLADAYHNCMLGL